MMLRKPILSRRKFLQLAGTTAALTAIPLGETLAASTSNPPGGFGGPTPNNDFYVTSYGSTPSVNASAWSLRIHGLVDHPLTLGYDAIKRLPAVKQLLTLECISNPPDGSAISNAEWTGARLRPLLDQAGVHSSAQYAVMRAADGYYTGVPVAEITREENWMPYLMNGAPSAAGARLPGAHFYPGEIRDERAQVDYRNRVYRSPVHRLLGGPRLEQRGLAQGQLGRFFTASVRRNPRYSVL
jgi:DMSO/TMAO reductase YedYZ molybdopterin-dependent catalytic subunit